MRRASSGSSFFSPLLKRTFSHITAWPGCADTPSSQSRITGTLRPSSSESRLATGTSDSSGSNLPSSGRPRWDIRMTRALASRAAWMVGSAARMRASLLTVPSCTGTFRSSRISTRLPASGSSLILSTFMARYRALLRAAPGQCRVEHAVGEAPFVVVPRAHLHQATVDDLGERGVIGGGRRVVVVVDGDQLRLGVVQDALQRAAGGGLHQL